MPRLSHSDLACVRDVVAASKALELDGNGRWPQVLERLRTATNGQFCALYRLSYVSEPLDNLEVEFCHSENGGRSRETFGADLQRYVREMGRPSILYDPVRPERKQRNIVLNPYEAVLPGSDQAEQPTLAVLAKRQDFDLTGQIRTLLCDGPILLGWFGGAWEKADRWRAAQMLKAVVPSVRERLMVDRAFGHAPLLSAALQATLEALAVPAFVTASRAGQVQIHATNSAGAAALDRPGSPMREALAAAVLGEPAPPGGPLYRVQALEAPGLPACQLVVERRPATPQAQLLAATRRFELTPRQREVLELVLLGHTNRTISELLRCAESTVELHVSALLDKSGSDSRSHLVARVWMLEA